MNRSVKALLLATMCFGTIISTHAISNQECVEVYRDGYLDLRESIESYNAKKIDKHTFAAEVTAQSTMVKTLRAACFLTESPEVTDCVNDYKDLYKDLRGRVRVRSVLSGNQDTINYSDSGARTGGFFGGLFNSGADAVKRTQLAVIDAKCL